MVEVNCSHRIMRTPCALSSSSFAPRSSSRRTASSLLNPDAALVQARSISAASDVCQAPRSCSGAYPSADPLCASRPGLSSLGLGRIPTMISRSSARSGPALLAVICATYRPHGRIDQNRS